MALLVLTLFTCVSSEYGQTQDAELLRIKTALASAESSVKGNFNAIEAIEIKRQGSAQSFISGYDPDEVIGGITEGKRKLIEGLSGDKLAGLRSYVQLFYPVPTKSSLKMVSSTGLGNTLVVESSKNEVFISSLQFIEKVRNVTSSDRLVINLTVKSDPSTADYDMWPDGGQHRTTSTNSTLDNVYRGYYTYRITKSGYKTIEQPLNLIDSDGRTLDCSLNKDSDSDGPHPCKLQ